MRIAIVRDGNFLYSHEMQSTLMLTIIDFQNDGIMDKTHIPLNSLIECGFVQFLYQQNVSNLIMGYITNRQKEACERKGIRVITGIAGRVEDVIAWFCNTFMIHEQGVNVTMC